jgi:tRNA-modifying protein YgfZ
MTAPLDPLDGVFFDLSSRVKLRITGADAERFLNGQLTNDVHKAAPANAIAACILNAKGRMNAHLFLAAEPDGFFVDADPELRDTLQPRLERYIIADAVEIEDVTERWSIFHVLNPTPPEVPAGGRIVSVNRFKALGWDVWTEASLHAKVFEQLKAAARFCDADCAEAFRIERGIPRWGRELAEELIPVEANLEQSSIDYEKGCYIGQEVISRMKMSGQANKRLRGLAAEDEAPLVAGMKLFTTDAEGKEAGWVTSVTHSERLSREIGLGYVKRGFNSIGFKLCARELQGAGPGGARVEVVDLPFSA